MDEKLRSRLVEFRKYHNYSQEEVSEKLKVSRQTVINWENGDSSPSIDYILDLAKIYGVTLDELCHSSLSCEEIYKRKEQDKVKEEQETFKKKVEEATKDDDIKDAPFVEISSRGIFINGRKKNKGNNMSWNDGREKVEITEDGIVIDGFEKYKGEAKTQLKNRKRKFLFDKVASALDGIMILLITVTYVTLGLINSAYWGILWPLFLTFDIIPGIVRMIGSKDPNKFPIVFVALSTYLFLGTLLPSNQGWHPYWVILFAIPLYYMICNSIRGAIREGKRISKQEQVIDEILDEEDDDDDDF